MLHMPKGGWVWNGVFPHCDPRILHKKNECVFCDKCDLLQFLREAWNINFTGHHQLADEQGVPTLPDPAEVARPLAQLQKWHGNQPKTQTALEDEDSLFTSLLEAFLIGENHEE